jgi:isoleucyl-tRNA synthetase
MYKKTDFKPSNF